MADEDVIVDHDADSAVLTVKINRPSVRNALSPDTFDELAQHFEQARTRSDVQVIVLTSTGDHFCSGWELGSDAATGAWGDEPGYPRFLRALEACSLPVIAAVRGYAIGAGLTMLGHVDLVLAGETAQFSAPFAQLGLCPESGSTATLSALLGHQRAAELLLTGKRISAYEAADYGLALRVVADTELNTAATALAANITQYPAQSSRATKRLLQKVRNDQALGARELEDAVFRELARTEVFQQIVTEWTRRKRKS